MTPPRVSYSATELKDLLERAEAHGRRTAILAGETYSAQEIEALMERIGEKVGHPEGCDYTHKATTLETIEHLALYPYVSCDTPGALGYEKHLPSTQEIAAEAYSAAMGTPGAHAAPETVRAIRKEDRPAIHPMILEEIKAATERAIDVFWESVAASFPDAKYGDFDPMAHAHFEETCRAAVTAWVEWNVPEPYAPAE